MEDIIDIIVTETTNLIEITSQPTDEIIDVNIIDNREDVTLNVTPTLVEININSLTGNFGILWGEIEGTLSNQTDLQNALNSKADLVDGKVPSSQLPSYVDDVVEVANYAALPVTGEVGKIYITLDTNFIYRWTGSTYVEIKDSSAVWGAITGTLSNQTDLQSALNAKQDDLNGTGFVKASGTTITYDNTSYLPLTGGTLTGNLNGTNITISNSLIAKGGTFNGGALSGGVVTIDGLGSDLLMNRADTSNGASITFLTNAVEKWNIGLRSAGTTDNFFIYNSNLTANALTINSATSAATFASSATATKFILSGGTGNTGLYYGHTDRVVLANYTTGGIDFEVNGGSIVATLFPSGNYGLGVALDAGYKLDVNGTVRISGALSGTSATFANSLHLDRTGVTAATPLRFTTAGSNDWFIGQSPLGTSTSDLFFYSYGTSSSVFTLSKSTGAATFSSSVTAKGFINDLATGISSSGGMFRLSNGYTYFSGSTTGNGAILGNGDGTATVQALRDGTGSAGYLVFETGAGSEKMRITSSGNVGIGTTAPGAKLTVNSGTTSGFSFQVSGTSTFDFSGNAKRLAIFSLNGGDGTGIQLGYDAVANTGVIAGSTNGTGAGIDFYTYNGSAWASKMRITSSGNVGIGTTAPNGGLTVVAPSSSTAISLWGRAGDNFSALRFQSNTGTTTYSTIYTNASDLIFENGGTARLTISSSGFATFSRYINLTCSTGGDAGIYIQNTSNNTSATAIEFRGWNGSTTGSIATYVNLTTYNTSSDYRLKEDLKQFSGLDLVSKLKMYDFKWKEADWRMYGGLAHEIQEVLPYAVTGVKDGKDTQGVDYSTIVPLLIQSIKELKGKIETLENK